jgi:hypothetical protein
VTKPKIAGHGLNWQHCRRTAFVGLSFSYEQFYQSLRRFLRYGQMSEVEAHIATSEREAAVMESIARKQADHEAMFSNMVAYTAGVNRSALSGTQRAWDDYQPTKRIKLPEWLKPGVKA